MSRTMKKICWISLIVAGAGLLLAITMFFAGASVGARISASGVELIGNSPIGEMKLVTQTGLDAFSSLSIRVESADVTVVEGDRFALELWSHEVSGNPLLQYSQEGNGLQIWDNLRGRGGWQLQFGFSFPQHWNEFPQNRVILTVPAGTRLETANISCDFGDLVVDGLWADKLELGGGYGSVSVSGGGGEALSLKLSGGALSLDGVEAGELRIKNSFGTVRVENSRRFQSVAISADSCDITLDGFAADSLDIRDNFGAVRLTGISLQRLDIQGDSCDISMDRVDAETAGISNNFGKIIAGDWSSGGLRIDSDSCRVEISGALRGSTEISNNFGDVILCSTLPRQSYGLDLDVSFGKIMVDGATFGEQYREPEEGRANHIRIGNDSGDIALSFGE